MLRPLPNTNDVFYRLETYISKDERNTMDYLRLNRDLKNLLQSDCPNAYHGMALLEKFHRNLDESRSFFLKAINLAPNEPSYNYNYGKVLLTTENSDDFNGTNESFSYIEKALNMGGEDLQRYVILYLLSSYFKMRFSQAIEFYDSKIFESDLIEDSAKKLSLDIVNGCKLAIKQMQVHDLSEANLSPISDIIISVLAKHKMIIDDFECDISVHEYGLLMRVFIKESFSLEEVESMNLDFSQFLAVRNIAHSMMSFFQVKFLHQSEMDAASFSSKDLESSIALMTPERSAEISHAMFEALRNTDYSNCTLHEA